MNSKTDLILLNFNKIFINSNIDTFNCFSNELNKEIIHNLSFSESWINDKNQNLYTVERYIMILNVTVAEL